MGERIMYQRISTRNQNLARQEAMAAEHNADKIFVDVMSGKDTKRPQLQEMLAYARAGDVLIIESLSRLGRSLKDLLEIISALTDKGVAIHSLKEQIDSTTASGRLQIALFAALSQFEREIMLERVAEGVAAAKAAGKFTGGKPKPTDWDKFKNIYAQWRVDKLTAVACQKLMGMTAATWYRRVRQWEANGGQPPNNATNGVE